MIKINKQKVSRTFNYTNLKYVQLYGIEPPHVETEITQQAPKPWAHDPKNGDL